MTITTTQAAAAIRKDLKGHGWSGRKVSIRAEYYSLGSSIRVVIKDAGVDVGLVKSIAEAHEIIHRDERTGEILGGGNRFVDVSVSSACRAELAAPYLDQLRQAVAKLDPAATNRLVQLEGLHGVWLGYEGPATYCARLWIDEPDGSGRPDQAFSIRDEDGLLAGAYRLALSQQ